MDMPAISAGAGLIVEQDGESEARQKTVESLHLLGRRILGVKCQGDHIRDKDGDVLLYMTDERLDNTDWFQVLKVGPGCRYLSEETLAKYDIYMFFPIWANGMHGLGNDLWIVNEALMDEKNPQLVPAAIFYEKEAISGK